MQSLAAALENTIRVYGAQPAVLSAGESRTWTQFGEDIARAADVLCRAGLVPGERFGLLGHNGVAQAELIYAGYWSGVVPVPVNFRLAPIEVAAILADAGCAYLCVGRAFLDRLEHPSMSAWRDRCLVMDASASEVHGLPDYGTLKAGADPLEPLESEEDDEALLLYTGGTTGTGKGVRISHRNMLTNALQTIGAMSPQPDDVYLHVTPMFHAGEVKSTIFTLCGAAHAYLSEFTPRGLLATIETVRATVIPMVPATIARVLDEPTRAEFDLSSLRLISYGTSPVGADMIRRMREAFPGVGLQQSYGVTECSPYIVMLDERSHERALAGEEHILRSAGRPLPGTELRLLDDAGHEVPRGDVGEVVIRGPQVALGYHNRPREQAEAFTAQGYRTGDVGRLDADGFVYLLDRKRDMVISGGENVYTQEIEAVIASHDGVREVAVIGVPHETFGEALFAVVVANEGWPPSVDDLVAHCRERIGGFKIPRRMAFVDALPRSAMGKVLKAMLRETYGGLARHE